MLAYAKPRVTDEIFHVMIFFFAPQSIGNALHILPSRKQLMTVLHNVSGIIKPRR
jgi:hypothetical protein